MKKFRGFRKSACPRQPVPWVKQRLNRPPDAKRLTPREREIVRLIAGCMGSKEIAAALGISLRTVQTHRANIFRKLELHSTIALVRYAIRTGLVRP